MGHTVQGRSKGNFSTTDRGECREFSIAAQDREAAQVGVCVDVRDGMHVGEGLARDLSRRAIPVNGRELRGLIEIVQDAA